MAQLTLKPTGDFSTELGIYPASPTTHYDKVDEATPDEDATYVYLINEEYYKFDWFHLENTVQTGTINWVRGYVRGKVTHAEPGEAGNSMTGVRCNSTTHTQGLGSLFTIYADLYHQWDINPVTEEAWTWDDINGMEVACGLNAIKTESRGTRVWFVVDYTPPAADHRRGSFFKMF